MRIASPFVVVLLLGISMSPGQDGIEPPAKPGPEAPWSEPVDGLQCWLQPNKAAWKVDEVPSFRLHVRNQGKRALEIHMAQAACKLEFDGAWFAWNAPVSIPGGTWPAGRKYEDFEVRVTLEAPWAVDNKPIALKPGKHKVRVAYVTFDRERPVRIVSNAVEIQVAAGGPMPRTDTDQAVRELKQEVKILRQRLETIEKRLSVIEKAKDK
jgi:hypothetical protein